MLQIRVEAGSIYYAENTFKLWAQNYDSQPLRFWTVKSRNVKDEFKVAKVMAAPTSVSQNLPHWQNLLRWMRDLHSGRLTWTVGPKKRQASAPAPLKLRVMGGMSSMVLALKTTPWEVIEGLLQDDRDILEHIEGGWAS